MCKLRKRDDTDRDGRRERPGAALMMTRDSSTKLRSVRTLISHGVEMDVCALPSTKVDKGIHEWDSVRSNMKPSKSPPSLGNEKLAEGQPCSGRQTNHGESQNTQRTD